MKSYLPLFAFLALAIAVQAEPKHVYEVLFLVDPQVIANFERPGYKKQGGTVRDMVEGDVDFLIDEIRKNLLDLDIELRTAGVVILEEEPFGHSPGSEIDAGKTLEKMKKWIQANDVYDCYKQDATLLLTGHKLRYSVGYAYSGAVCTDNALGVVTYYGTGSSATLATHELTHILGGDHDGGYCNDNFIMSSVNFVSEANRLFFSRCSKDSVNRHLATLGPSHCLSRPNTTADPMNFDVTSLNGRDMIDRDQQCIRAFGAEASYCSFGSETEESLCRGFLCREYSSASSCKYVSTLDFIHCSDTKRCQRNKCLAAPAGLPVPAERPVVP